MVVIVAEANQYCRICSQLLGIIKYFRIISLTRVAYARMLGLAHGGSECVYINHMPFSRGAARGPARGRFWPCSRPTIQCAILRKPPPPSVLTAQYGNLRQAYNASESMLTSTCISGGTVSLAPPSWAPLLVEPGVSGFNNGVQAQPLYVSQITKTPALNNCPNPCDILLAVTLTDSVYRWSGGS